MAERKSPTTAKTAPQVQTNYNFSRLYRSEHNRMIAGVCGGIGEFFNVDPSIVRFIFVLITIFGGSGILLYIILWIILPTESSVKGTTESHVKANVEEIRGRAEKFASEVRDRHGSPNRVWWGLAIFVIGLLFLFSNFGFLGIFDWGRFWPVILIIFGLFLLMRRNEK